MAIYSNQNGYMVVNPRGNPPQVNPPQVPTFDSRQKNKPINPTRVCKNTVGSDSLSNIFRHIYIPCCYFWQSETHTLKRIKKVVFITGQFFWQMPAQSCVAQLVTSSWQPVTCVFLTEAQNCTDQYITNLIIQKILTTRGLQQYIIALFDHTQKVLLLILTSTQKYFSFYIYVIQTFLII